MIEQPGDLAGGKIRIEQQSGLAGNFTFVTGTMKRFAKICGASVLPDNGIMNGFPGFAIPNNGGFTLVSDPNAGDIFRRNAGLRHHGTNRCDDSCPDFFRIVLDLAGHRIDLAQLMLGGCEWPQGGVKRDRPCGRCPLIDSDESGRHVYVLSFVHPATQ